MALSSCSETGHVDVAYTVGTVDGILLDCAAISHMFLNHHLFTSYRPLVNNEYITVGGHN